MMHDRSQLNSERKFDIILNETKDNINKINLYLSDRKKIPKLRMYSHSLSSRLHDSQSTTQAIGVRPKAARQMRSRVSVDSVLKRLATLEEHLDGIRRLRPTGYEVDQMSNSIENHGDHMLQAQNSGDDPATKIAKLSIQLAGVESLLVKQQVDRESHETEVNNKVVNLTEEDQKINSRIVSIESSLTHVLQKLNARLVNMAAMKGDQRTLGTRLGNIETAFLDGQKKLTDRVVSLETSLDDSQQALAARIDHTEMCMAAGQQFIGTRVASVETALQDIKKKLDAGHDDMKVQQIDGLHHETIILDATVIQSATCLDDVTTTQSDTENADTMNDQFPSATEASEEVLSQNIALKAHAAGESRKAAKENEQKHDSNVDFHLVETDLETLSEPTHGTFTTPAVPATDEEIVEPVTESPNSIRARLRRRQEWLRSQRADSSWIQPL